MNTTLYVMVGLPGSGKSTFLNTADFIYADTTVVSTDNYVQYFADAAGLSYDDVWAETIGDATVRAEEAAREAAACGLDVVWDQTNLGTKKRRKLLDKFPGYRTVAIVVSCDEDVRQSRLKQRPGKTIPAHVDAQMRTSFVPPSLDEGFDEIIEVRT